MDIFIVAEHVGWPLNRDIKHLQLVPKGFYQLGFCLESNELDRELPRLDSVLLLNIPKYGGLVHRY